MADFVKTNVNLLIKGDNGLQLGQAEGYLHKKSGLSLRKCGRSWAISHDTTGLLIIELNSQYTYHDARRCVKELAGAAEWAKRCVSFNDARGLFESDEAYFAVQNVLNKWRYMNVTLLKSKK